MIHGLADSHHRASIFVLDDSQVILSQMRILLESEGYQVHTFDSPLGITREVMRLHPDLVLVDINMPSITGDKVCRLIRSASHARDVLILLHSSLSESDLQEIARASGADGAITKTSDGRAFVQAIERFLARRTRTTHSGLLRPLKVP